MWQAWGDVWGHQQRWADSHRQVPIIHGTHQVWKRSRLGWARLLSTLTCAKNHAIECRQAGQAQCAQRAQAAEHKECRRRTSCSTRAFKSLLHAFTTTYSRLCFSRALYTLLCRPRPMIS